MVLNEVAVSVAVTCEPLFCGKMQVTHLKLWFQ